MSRNGIEDGLIVRNFRNAKDFAKFVTEFGTIDGKMSSHQKEPLMTPVFEAPIDKSEMWDTNYKLWDTNYKPSMFYYEAYCCIGDTKILASLSNVPGTPEGWKHGFNKTIKVKFDAKKEVLEFLLEEGVSEEDLKKLNKVTLTHLRELIDSSNKEFMETMERKPQDEALHYKFKARGGREFFVDIQSTSHHNGIEFRVSQDWTAEWQKRAGEIETELSKFTKYRT